MNLCKRTYIGICKRIILKKALSQTNIKPVDGRQPAALACMPSFQDPQPSQLHSTWIICLTCNRQVHTHCGTAMPCPHDRCPICFCFSATVCCTRFCMVACAAGRGSARNQLSAKASAAEHLAPVAQYHCSSDANTRTMCDCNMQFFLLVGRSAWTQSQ